jgi:hypothetical protein
MRMREELGMLYEDGVCTPYVHSRARIQVPFCRADCLIQPTRFQCTKSATALCTLAFRPNVAAAFTPMAAVVNDCEVKDAICPPGRLRGDASAVVRSTFSNNSKRCPTLRDV